MFDPLYYIRRQGERVTQEGNEEGKLKDEKSL